MNSNSDEIELNVGLLGDIILNRAEILHVD